MCVSGGCVCLLEDKGSLVDSYVVMRGAMGHPIESINKRHFVHIEEAENADCTMQCTNIIVTDSKQTLQLEQECMSPCYTRYQWKDITLTINY